MRKNNRILLRHSSYFVPSLPSLLLRLAGRVGSKYVTIHTVFYNVEHSNGNGRKDVSHE